MAHPAFFRHSVGGLLAIIIAPLIYMAFLDTRPPATLHHMAITGDLWPGGKVAVTFDATVHRNCQGVARRRLTGSNGVIFEYEPLPSIIYDPGGARRRFVREIELPLAIPSGETAHDVRIWYYCNFMQRAFGLPIVLDRPTLRFTIQ